MEKQKDSVTRLTLVILPTEIQYSNYVDGFGCAITKALARAGRPDLMDIGNGIRLKDEFKRFEAYNMKGYKKLRSYVLSQYSNKDKKKSSRNRMKEFTIEIDELVYSDACMKQVPEWLAKLRKLFGIKK